MGDVTKLKLIKGGKPKANTLADICQRFGCASIDMSYMQGEGYFVTLGYTDRVVHGTGPTMREALNEALKL